MPALITDANWALTAIIIADTWEWFPFTMLMILAALQMMPEEHIDAARVDGASRLADALVRDAALSARACCWSRACSA